MSRGFWIRSRNCVKEGRLRVHDLAEPNPEGGSGSTIKKLQS